MNQDVHEPAGCIDEEKLFRDTVRKLGGDIARYFPGFIIPALISALHVYIFTRVFDPAEFGRYSLVFAACHLLTLLLGGWLTQSVLRYQPRYREGEALDGFVASLSRLLERYGVGLAVVFALGWFAVGGSLGSYAPYYLPGAVMVVAGVVFLVLKSMLQAGLQAGAVTRIHILYALLRLALSLAFVIWVYHDAVGLVVGPALAYLLLLPPMAMQLRISARRSTAAARPQLARMFTRYGLPMVGWLIGVHILELSDRYIIEMFRGTGEVGIYSANYNLVSMALWVAASPVITAAYPLITNAWESGNRDGIQDLVATFSRYFLMIAVPLVALVSVLAFDIVSIFIGEAFREGYVVIPPVLAGLLFWHFGFYGDNGLRLAEKTGLVFALVMVSAATNVVLNLILVPKMGYRGAAFSTLVSSIVYPVVVWIAARRTIAWRIPWLSAFRILGAGLAAAVLAKLCAMALSEVGVLVRVIVSGGLGAVTYPAALWILREFRPYELRLLRSWLRGGFS